MLLSFNVKLRMAEFLADLALLVTVAGCLQPPHLSHPSNTAGCWCNDLLGVLMQVRFCAALSLAHEVKLQPQELLGRTPGLISPSLVSPAAADEPGTAPEQLRMLVCKAAQERRERGMRFGNSKPPYRPSVG